MTRTLKEEGLTRNQIIQELSRSTHGKLSDYVAVGKRAAVEEPDFFAHVIAWNEKNGQIRDSKKALPAIALSFGGTLLADDHRENALAHLASLNVRELVAGLRFFKEVGKQSGNGKAVRRMVERYLRHLEKDYRGWQRVAVQHREDLATLYAINHVKPGSPVMDGIMFKQQYPAGSIFHQIRLLHLLPAAAIAATIKEYNLPWQVIQGAVGARLKEPDIMMAAIDRMSPTQLVTNMKLLEKLGVRNQPITRAALEEALDRGKKSKAATFKTTRAAEHQTDDVLKAKLRGMQEKQIDTLGKIAGSWGLLVDQSGSMEESIELGKEVAAALARFVEGKVHLVYFHDRPTYYDVTNQPYDAITLLTKYIRPGGSGTSIGVGLAYLLDQNIEVDGIAIVSDANENTPPHFADRYKRYCQRFDKEPAVYLYRVSGSHGWHDTDLAVSMRTAGLDMVEFDLRNKSVDYNSLPNIVKTMKANKWRLQDDIMATPLLTLDEVFA